MMSLLNEIKTFLIQQQGFGDSLYRLSPDRPKDLINTNKVEVISPSPTDFIQQCASLADLADFARNHIFTPIDETRKNLVFGVGNPNATLMVIGEAPGADEDAKGEPFVGKSGQLLTKILAAVHFNRPEIYIANILKSRPPNNRDPLPEEVKAHFPILVRQIELIQPKIILCAGRVAGNNLLGKSETMGKLRDGFHNFMGIPVVVTYHPAALLRNEQWKRPTWEDVQKLRAKHDELVGVKS